MYKKRNRWKTFLVWMRNGIAFCYSWLLILILVCSCLFKIEMLPVEMLVKVFVMVAGEVFLFTLFFFEGVLNKMSFMTRMSYMVITGIPYEIACFYWIGIFQKSGSILGWGIFAGIIAVLYASCILIYHKYSKTKGEIYTKNLIRYQQTRSLENE